jgi:hypothetical protein
MASQAFGRLLFRRVFLIEGKYAAPTSTLCDVLCARTVAGFARLIVGGRVDNSLFRVD